MVKKLSEKVKIKALHFDQECSRSSIESLLKMYIRVDKIFPVSAILRPSWLTSRLRKFQDDFTNQTFYELFSDCETLVDALMKITKYTDLMAYDENYTLVSNYMEKLKEINMRHTHNEAKNIIEIGWGSNVPEDGTLHQRFLEDKDKLILYMIWLKNIMELLYIIMKDGINLCIVYGLILRNHMMEMNLKNVHRNINLLFYLFVLI